MSDTIALWESEIEDQYNRPLFYLNRQINEAFDDIERFNNVVSYCLESDGIILEFSVEDVKRKVKELWEKFKKWFKELIKKVQGIIDKVLDKVKNVTERAKKALPKAKKIDEFNARSSKNESTESITESKEDSFPDVEVYGWGTPKMFYKCGKAKEAFSSSISNAMSCVSAVNSLKAIDDSNVNLVKAKFIDLLGKENGEIEKYCSDINETFPVKHQTIKFEGKWYDYMEMLTQCEEDMKEDIYHLKKCMKLIDAQQEKIKLDMNNDSTNPEVSAIYSKISLRTISILKEFSNHISRQIVEITRYQNRATDALRHITFKIEAKSLDMMNS